jgi:ubiquinone/menaquinone biosynthesis C-methylase UbiE
MTTVQLPAHGVEPFDAVAGEYDARFTNSLIGRAQRESVWTEMDRLFGAGQRILEINCGTGVDARRLSARGIHVVACDSSPEMVAVARRSLDLTPFPDRVEFRVLAIEQISQLGATGFHDGALSNFAGLNCVADLQNVARDLARMVKPGGKMLLCLFGRFCLWEIVWYALHGNIKKAFRRLRDQGVLANLAPNQCVVVRYPSVGFLRRAFGPHFRLVNWKGIGVAVPPSYLEPWAARFVRLFKIATLLDHFLGRCPGFRALADHVMLIFERVEV